MEIETTKYTTHGYETVFLSMKIIFKRIRIFDTTP